MSRDANNGFEEWGGYMEAKITKLEEQFSASSDPFRQSNLFAGISIYVNGLTHPSADELKRIMMVHGGTFHHYERSHTTYIIAANLPDVKVRNMNTSKIISAQWVVDCVREQRILDYTRYLLYTNQKSTQPRLTFEPRKNNNGSLLNGTLPAMHASAASSSDLSTIMHDLQELNAKIRQSLEASASVKEQKLQVEEVEVERKPLESILNASASTSSNKGSASSSVARTAVDPKFLSEFYNNSRLHHIATLGAGFKQYISDLREKHDHVHFPARAQMKDKLLANGASNFDLRLSGCVMHIDMDCFFVSVGLRNHPHLRGQPVAVTHSKGGSAATEVPVHPGADRQVEMELFAKRFEQQLHNNILTDKVRQGFDSKMSLSEIASCSYEARAKGIRNGMFVGQAIKLCPELKTIPYDFEGYKEVAFTLYDTIAQYTLNIEAVSCDEMFVELSDVLDELKLSPMIFVQAIREEVQQKTGCTCSAGVGSNKLQARMATKIAKPAGQYQLEATNVLAFMADIPISDLPGVGSSTMYTLKKANLMTCSDLQRISLAKLQMLVGKKFGETLHQFCRGIDERSLVYEQVRKSVSAEVNYGIRFSEHTELETFLRQLCTEVHTRLLDIRRKTKCITLKLMVRAKDAPVETSKFMGHGVCDNVTKSVSLSDFSNDLELITRTTLSVMKALSLPPNELRGIGIQLSKLDDPTEGKEKKENVIKNMFSKAVEKQKLNEKNVEFLDKKLATMQPKTHADSNIKTTNTSAAVVTSTKESKKRANGDVMDMLQNAGVKKFYANDSNLQCPADVDPDVFAALPNDIRAEILRERGLQKHIQPDAQKCEANTLKCYELNESDLRPSTSKAAQARLQEKQQSSSKDKIQVDEEFLRALPPEIRAEIELQMKLEQSNGVEVAQEQSYKEYTPLERKDIAVDATPPAIVDIDNIFAQEKCIQLLLEWVQSSDAPENYDVDLISCHAREFVRCKLIDKLYEPLMYLCRLINSQKPKESDCAWHMAYKMIIEAVQLEMREIYEGRKLFLGVKLQCDKCCLDKCREL